MELNFFKLNRGYYMAVARCERLLFSSAVCIPIFLTSEKDLLRVRENTRKKSCLQTVMRCFVYYDDIDKMRNKIQEPKNKPAYF